MPLLDQPPGQPGQPRAPVHRWPGLEPYGATAVVTTRHGGVSTGAFRSLNLALHVGDEPEAVVENRTRAAHTIGARCEDLVIANQVHGNHVAVVGREHRGRGTVRAENAIAATDALVTVEPGVPLVILVADCVPILLLDPAVPVLACVHAGWRGTVADVVGAAVAEMAELGGRAERIRAGIGPAVSPEHYEVDAAVAGPLQRVLGDDARRALCPVADDRWRADLPEANRILLAAHGVPESHIHAMSASSSDEDFFSHRRDGRGGRFALLATLTT